MKLLSVVLLSVLGSNLQAAPAKMTSTPLYNYENIYIAGTPTEKELADFKKQKGAVVLDLRAVDELGNCSEPAAAAKLGLQYNRVNFEHNQELDPEVISQIDSAVEKANGKPILLFCKSGNRSSAWLATYLYREKGMSIDEAVNFARSTGLKPELENSVREYLKTAKK